MVWFFTRGRDVVRIETRFDSRTGEYVLTIGWAGGRETVEWYQTVDAFAARLRILEAELARDRWSQNDGPKLLVHSPRSSSLD